MRQKYIISTGSKQNRIKISECAIIDKHLDKVRTSMLEVANYSLLAEEIYERDIIMDAITDGINSLISVLRTKNLYPIEQRANKIAKSVIAFCKNPEDAPIELLFDDFDVLSDKF